MILLSVLLAGSGMADGDVAIDETNFPDAVFRDHIADNYDSDKNGKLDQDEISIIYSLSVSYLNIGSLKGVEYFGSLTWLFCDGNRLTTLDVSKNTGLVLLNCSSNQLKSIDLSGNPQLQTLYISDNQLTKLDVSKNTELTDLFCRNNAITSLDLSKNTKLKQLILNQTRISALDLSSNTELTQIGLDDCKVTAIDLSGSVNLRSLWCRNTGLTGLDLSKCTALEELNCDNNGFTKLNVGSCPKLRYLSCQHNSLAKLDLSRNAELNKLFCGFNGLTALDLSACTNLDEVSCGGNRLTSLDLSAVKDPGMLYVSCEGNSLDITASGGMVYLNKLPGFDVSKAGGWPDSAVVKGSTLKMTKSAKIKYTYEYAAGRTAEFTLNIKVAKAALTRMTLSKTKMAYTGKALKPNVTVKARVGAKTLTLTKGTDYTVTYKNNVKAGTATVTVKGKGGFKGTLQKTFTITPVKIKTAALSKTKMTYTGKALKPKVTVTAVVNGKTVTLKKDTDYTVKYENNVETGTAKVIITGKGNFKGSIIKTFRIVKK